MPLDAHRIALNLSARGITTERLAVGLGVFAVSVILSLALVTAVIVRMPATYFEKGYVPRANRPAWMRVALTVGKNVLGVALVVFGVVLSVPGVPGQGILTILVGMMLLDIPGKRRLERRIVSNRRILATMNRVRRRFGREPLRV